MFSFLRRPKPSTFVLVAKPAAATPAPSTPLVREPADRSAHQDDQHLVFWDADVSQASAEQSSDAAVAWHQAVDKKA